MFLRRITGSADLFAARWDAALPGSLAAGRRPACGYNSVSYLAKARSPLGATPNPYPFIATVARQVCGLWACVHGKSVRQGCGRQPWDGRTITRMTADRGSCVPGVRDTPSRAPHGPQTLHPCAVIPCCMLQGALRERAALGWYVTC